MQEKEEQQNNTKEYNLPKQPMYCMCAQNEPRPIQAQASCLQAHNGQSASPDLPQLRGARVTQRPISGSYASTRSCT